MSTTPMLQQYHRIKRRYKDCILFFRLGDFYEMFGEDARLAAKELDLVLTSRGKGTPHEVPMCGIPHHAADGYIARLIKAGHRIAICEQIEDPSTAKGLVKRDVVRLITAGTYLDETSHETRVLVSLMPPSKSRLDWGVAFLDLTDGEILFTRCNSPAALASLLVRLNAAECLFPESFKSAVDALFSQPLLLGRSLMRTPYEDWIFQADLAIQSLCEHFKTTSLAGFGLDTEKDTNLIQAAGGLLEYVKSVNRQPLKHIHRLKRYTDEEFVYISPAALSGLELPRLLKTIDFTQSALGKRRLKDWLWHPLKKPAAILQRQAAVTLLVNDPQRHEALRQSLKELPDFEKSLSRLSCGYMTGRDLFIIRQALITALAIRDLLVPLSEKNRLFIVEDIPALREKLEAAIDPDMPLSKNEGRVIRPGYHPKMDEWRHLLEHGHEWLKTYQAKEIQRTGIPSLKVGYNKVYGYYIEVTRPHLKSVPDDYVRRQTLVNAERFITLELKDFEEKILSAKDNILTLEEELMQDLKNDILAHTEPLHKLARQLSVVDALNALAHVARRRHYTAPQVDESLCLTIEEGRHPVVEQHVGGDFIPNDTTLNDTDQHCVVLTGPNMAGKSTYIRQTALIVILAQIGSYVPAKHAHIGVVDRIFTRIGAHDDLAKGQSTFMVEMNETAEILHNLTERSLVILDEVGRGTSTYDGLALAWAITEHLAQKRVRTLFATHFHELTALAGQWPGVKNYNVSVKEWNGQIIFLHKIVPGGCDDSYGLYVARLAGVPESILKRAAAVLSRLELQSSKTDLMTPTPPPSRDNLWTEHASHTEATGVPSRPSLSPPPTAQALFDELSRIQPETMTPLQALSLLAQWKETYTPDRTSQQEPKHQAISPAFIKDNHS